MGSAARMGKGGDRSDNENYGNDYSAVAINLLRSRGLLIVIENCRHQDLNQGKENKQCAHEKKDIHPPHLRQARQLRVHGESIRNQRQHRSNGDAELRARVRWIRPENGP